MDTEIALVVSVAARRTLALEGAANAWDGIRVFATRCHAVNDMGASIASGSVPVSGMSVAPCSMRTLPAIAHGLEDNLLTREAPLTLADLRSMTAATEVGAILLPPEIPYIFPVLDVAA